MKKYIFFILSILPLFVYAQNSVKAKEILDKTAMTLQKGAGIRATFHGTQSGTMFRLKGKGVPKVHSTLRGDQYVKVIVDIPKNLNSKQKEALEAFMEACGESVDGEVTHKKGFKDFCKFYTRKIDKIKDYL